MPSDYCASLVNTLRARALHVPQYFKAYGEDITPGQAQAVSFVLERLAIELAHAIEYDRQTGLMEEAADNAKREDWLKAQWAALGLTPPHVRDQRTVICRVHHGPFIAYSKHVTVCRECKVEGARQRYHARFSKFLPKNTAEVEPT